MSTFRDVINSDLNIFFNQDEFASVKEVNAQQITVIEADDELTQRKLKSPDGTFIGDKLIIVKVSEFGSAPTIGKIISYVSKKYRVTDVNINEGTYEITLEAFKA